MRFLNWFFKRRIATNQGNTHESLGEYMEAEGLDAMNLKLKEKWEAELAYEEKRLICIEKAVCQSTEEGDGNAQDFFLKWAEETSERIRDFKRKLQELERSFT